VAELTTTIDHLVANNRSYADRLEQRHLDVSPSKRLAIVTCMDSRLDVFAALGLGDGEAHILRNAGGVITDDVIRSLAISQRKLGTREVMLIHHTDCRSRPGLLRPSRSSRSQMLRPTCASRFCAFVARTSSLTGTSCEASYMTSIPTAYTR
jgi:carbonic anhydrase